VVLLSDFFVSCSVGLVAKGKGVVMSYREVAGKVLHV
jgi:hypothetical protein